MVTWKLQAVHMSSLLLSCCWFGPLGRPSEGDYTENIQPGWQGTRHRDTGIPDNQAGVVVM